MKSAFAFTLMSFAIVACSNGGGNSGQAKTNQSGQTQFKTTDITDRSICQNQAPIGISLFTYEWAARHLAKNGVVLERTMHFNSNSVEVLMEASYEKDSREIRVRSRISTANGVFQILDSDSDQVTLPTGNDNFKVSFELRPITINYSFVGPCLKISTGSEELVLTPKEK